MLTALFAEVHKHGKVLTKGAPACGGPAAGAAGPVRPLPLPWRPPRRRWPRPARPWPPPPQDGGRRGSARAAGRGCARGSGRRRPQGPAAPEQRPPAQRPGFAGERAEVPPRSRGGAGSGRAGRSAASSRGRPRPSLGPALRAAGGVRGPRGTAPTCPLHPLGFASFSSHAPLGLGSGGRLWRSTRPFRKRRVLSSREREELSRRFTSWVLTVLEVIEVS